MAVLSTVIAASALAITAVGTANSIKARKEQAKFAQQAADMQQKQANLSNARAKRDAVREARIAYGQSQNAAANQGVSGASGSQGALSSIAAQASDNVSFLDQYGFYSDQASKALGRSNAAGARADTASAIAGFGMSVFNNASGIANVFRPST